MAERFTGRLADVIRRPLITEKATRALDLNQYTFEVDHRAANFLSPEGLNRHGNP